MSVREQYRITRPLYAARQETMGRIPNFWPLVFEQAPPEIDQYIQTDDSRVLADSLESILVSRPELDASGGSSSGNPRSLRIRFAFKPNDDFEDRELVKDFWWRRARDGWTGLVSEPVRIRWKPGRDLTRGLSDRACELFAARRKTGDMTSRGLPEYTALRKEVESWNARNTSFFTWFGWVSDRRFVSAEESDEANRKFGELKERRKRGDKAEMPEHRDEDMEGNDDTEVEAMDAGEDLAICIAEELWPSAIRYFTEAQESEDMSELDFEEDEDEEDDDGLPVDIRSLVQPQSKGRPQGGAPPAKRQKK